MSRDQKFLYHSSLILVIIICYILYNQYGKFYFKHFFEHIQNDVKNGTPWIYVEFFDCPSVLEINVNKIRAALARWINEECATAILCNLNSTIELKNVLVGTIFCGVPNNFITFLVLRNSSIHPSLQGYHLYHLTN